jgi:hypothetical protein
MEHWIEYKNTGYLISNYGLVMSPSGQILKPDDNGFGYLRVNLGRNIRKLIHILVAHCHIGPKPEGLEVDHINRNRSDNRVENLRYVTPRENNKNRIDSRTDITETDPVIRNKISMIDCNIRLGRYKKPRDYYITLLYNRLNRPNPQG